VVGNLGVILANLVLVVGNFGIAVTIAGRKLSLDRTKPYSAT
jgi:hypothetical protein